VEPTGSIFPATEIPTYQVVPGLGWMGWAGYVNKTRKRFFFAKKKQKTLIY
jgi:hypothetical protein